MEELNADRDYGRKTQKNSKIHSHQETKTSSRYLKQKVNLLGGCGLAIQMNDI